MKQQDVCVVELQPGHAEYNTVASKFNQTCSRFRIQKVSLLLTWSFLTVEISGTMVLDKYINTFAFIFHLFFSPPPRIILRSSDFRL